MSEDSDVGIYESYKSPTERLKVRILDLLFENISHNSKSRTSTDEKYAFCTKTHDLSILIDRFTPKAKRKELLDWYTQLDNEIKTIKDSKDYTLTSERKEDTILNLQYRYALEVHMHNERIILNSPIIESEVEGELDVNDGDLLNIVRLKESRKDDGKLEFKR